MMNKDDVPGAAGPLPVEVEEGRTYWWCTCGQSARQPFCDGSHKGSSFVPQAWESPRSGKVFFCGCKKTGRAPLCDGTHSRISKDEA